MVEVKRRKKRTRKVKEETPEVAQVPEEVKEEIKGEEPPKVEVPPAVEPPPVVDAVAVEVPEVKPEPKKKKPKLSNKEKTRLLGVGVSVVVGVAGLGCAIYFSMMRDTVMALVAGGGFVVGGAVFMILAFGASDAKHETKTLTHNGQKVAANYFTLREGNPDNGELMPVMEFGYEEKPRGAMYPCVTDKNYYGRIDLAGGKYMPFPLKANVHTARECGQDVHPPEMEKYMKEEASLLEKLSPFILILVIFIEFIILVAVTPAGAK